MIYLELLDRNNRVIGRQSVEAGAFPVTIRLADGQETPLATPFPVETDAPSERPVLSEFWNRVMSPRGAVTTIIATTIVFTAVTYAHMFTKSGRTMLLEIMLGYLTLFTLWSGGWALGGRIARQQARFRDQFTWTCICAIAMLGFGYGVQWEEFLFPGSEVFGICVALIGVITTIVALYGHLSIASKMPPRRRWRAAVATVGVCVALISLVVYAGSDDFNTSLTYDSSMQPLDARFIPSESVSEFTKDIAALQKRVDREAKKQ
jgi:hypothetical protein